MLTPKEIQLLADAIVERMTARAHDVDPVGDCHDCARWLGVSVATVERHVRSGAIPSFKIGSCRRFRRSEVIRAGEVIHGNS